VRSTLLVHVPLERVMGAPASRTLKTRGRGRPRAAAERRGLRGGRLSCAPPLAAGRSSGAPARPRCSPRPPRGGRAGEMRLTRARRAGANGSVAAPRRGAAAQGGFWWRYDFDEAALAVVAAGGGAAAGGDARAAGRGAGGGA
jgi:hypothetical protein